MSINSRLPNKHRPRGVSSSVDGIFKSNKTENLKLRRNTCASDVQLVASSLPVKKVNPPHYQGSRVLQAWSYPGKDPRYPVDLTSDDCEVKTSVSSALIKIEKSELKKDKHPHQSNSNVDLDISGLCNISHPNLISSRTLKISAPTKFGLQMETECTNLIWGGSLGVYMDVFLSYCFTQSQSALVLCASTWSDLESVFLAIYFTEPAFWCLVSELLGVLTVMSEELHHAASHYILTNCDECLPFIKEHNDILRIQYDDDQVDELHMKTFVKWFSERIEQLYAEGKESAQMFSLAQGSGKQAIYYKGYNIHGFRFHTERHDENKKTQNSGVMVKGEKEINCVPWYGTLTDIVELWYTDQNKVILFHCNWFDTATKGKGYKEDRYDILSVNNKGKLNTQEPFVLASQATQVYYVTGIKNCTWSVVVETKPRNIFEMPTDEEEPYQQEESQSSHTYANRNVEEDDEE
ncbi:hypothetical protein ACLB2K_020776 [Fragaria x ananassa]